MTEATMTDAEPIERALNILEFLTGEHGGSDLATVFDRQALVVARAALARMQAAQQVTPEGIEAAAREIYEMQRVSMHGRPWLLWDDLLPASREGLCAVALRTVRAALEPRP